jgi:ribonuclease PH
MSGAEKVFAIARALVQTATEKGVKADADILFTVLLDVAQAAYRASLPNIEGAIVALAAAFTTNPLVGTVAELVGEEVQSLLTRWGSPSPASTVAAPAAAF